MAWGSNLCQPRERVLRLRDAQLREALGQHWHDSCLQVGLDLQATPISFPAGKGLPACQHGKTRAARVPLPARSCQRQPWQAQPSRRQRHRPFFTPAVAEQPQLGLATEFNRAQQSRIGGHSGERGLAGLGGLPVEQRPPPEGTKERTKADFSQLSSISANSVFSPQIRGES